MPLQVLSWGRNVLRWLYMTVQHSAADQRALTIEAFAAWVRLGLLYEQDLPSPDIQGLLNLTFQYLLDSSESKLNIALQQPMYLFPSRLSQETPKLQCPGHMLSASGTAVFGACYGQCLMCPWLVISWQGPLT